MIRWSLPPSDGSILTLACRHVNSLISYFARIYKKYFMYGSYMGFVSYQQETMKKYFNFHSLSFNSDLSAFFFPFPFFISIIEAGKEEKNERNHS